MSLKNIILIGDVLEKIKEIPACSVNTCVTSTPYWGLRDYGMNGQIGNESSPEEFIQKMVDVFREVRRVLRDDGTLWLNLGDSYSNGGRTTRAPDSKNIAREMDTRPDAGLKPKDLVGIPWRVALALQADGWYLRQDIIWHKPNPMPESVRDRCTKAHEYIFLLSKSPKYYYDYEAIKEPATSVEEHLKRKKIVKSHGDSQESTEWMSGGHNALSLSETRNKRSVWTVATKPFSGAHFATFPPELIEPCILAGSPVDGIVLDPFFGAGTVGVVCQKTARNYIGIELNPEYAEMAENRIKYGTVKEEELKEEKKQGRLF